MSAFVILNLIASGSFSSLDLEVAPGSHIRWIKWIRDEYERHYQGEPEGRLLVELAEDHGEREAQWIAEVLSALLDLVHGPSGMTLGVLEVSTDTVSRGKLLADEIRASIEVFDHRWEHATSAWFPSDPPIWVALQALPCVLAAGNREHGLPAAVLYYKLSTAEFAFMGDSVAWALGEDGEKVPDSGYDRARAEQAFHNAFKAIEALVGGEPSSDDRKFRQRLVEAGVDPDEPVGFRGRPKEPLFTVLKRIRKTRDARAAHAGRTSSPRRGLSPFELMEAQHAAAAALSQAVMTRAPAAALRPKTDELGRLLLNG